MIDWLIGILASGAIAGLAYWKRSLSGSGYAAAVVVGTILYALGSPAWFGTLIAFFISSTLLSKWKQRSKTEVESGYEKSGRRDAGQVLANGGLGVLLCLLNVWHPDPMWWLAFLGVMATVNADTWATEVGGLSRTQPRSILTLQKVPAGTSGGVTVLGLAATMLGAWFIGLIGWLLLSDGVDYPYGALIPQLTALLAGTLGSLADSFLGATLQRLNRCTICGKIVEAHTHCGLSTEPAKGLRWMNNDLVNLFASILGGLAALWIGTSL